MKSLIIRFLRSTAWPMKQPVPYSFFHIFLACAGIFCAFFAARKLTFYSIKRQNSGYKYLFICGIILALSEVYKQLFLYWIVNDGSYDWWYFPFQLCSVPMYLCLFIPILTIFFQGKYVNILCTFIQDFGLLGGLMALGEPSGLMHPYWTLTLHGFFWHFMLIFAALFCSFRGLSIKNIRGYFRTIPLFIVCCIIASAVNILSHPYGNADMFYISPYYPNGQIVFHTIALELGILPGNLIYLAGVIAGGAVFHGLAGVLSAVFADRHKPPLPPDPGE